MHRDRTIELAGSRVLASRETIEQIKASRKQQHRPVADFLNRCAALKDRLLPGEFASLYRQVSPYSMMSHARLRGIHRGVLDVLRRGVPGDLVECGTARGGCAALMALTCRSRKQPRDLWIFDTFEGLPSPTSDDPDYEVALTRQGECRGDYQEVAALLAQLGVLDHAHLVKGLFQQTLPGTDLPRIAVLHLDGDWYESTRVCLEHLYDRVSPGGVVQIDDYGHWAGARKALHEFFDERGIQPRLRYLDYTGRSFIKSA